MRLGSIRRRVSDVRSWALLGGVSMVFGVVPGCDPEVSNTLVKGMAEAAVAAIEAMFTRPEPGSQTGDIPSVFLDTVQHLVTMLT